MGVRTTCALGAVSRIRGKAPVWSGSMWLRIM